MHIETLDRGAFSSALVKLSSGERFVSESGAMFRCSSNIEIDVTTKGSGKSGGLLGGLKRMLAGENFFFSTYTCQGEDGEVGLAPTLQGEVKVIECDGSRKIICTGGSYIGSTTGLNIDTKFQGLKGFLTGESISFVEVSGQGQLLVSAFGRIVEIDVTSALTIDTGHVVAFEDSLPYSAGKAASGGVQSFLSGEGIVLKFTGEGKVYVQSHNPSEFGSTIGPMLPERS
ncbi:MAG: TIGR00266 family protein [Pirellulaceae bacterium]